MDKIKVTNKANCEANHLASFNLIYNQNQING